ncbi:MAG: class I SAM-dependent rRNA methyltransferase [Spirochaetota bacterium]
MMRLQSTGCHRNKMYKLILKPGREKSVKNRHPWLFSGAVKTVEGGPSDGDIVDVFSSSLDFLGRGCFNKKTSIAVRLLTFNDELIDAGFWTRRLQQALEYRQTIIDTISTTACRLVNGEGDYLPGLVVDRYGDYLVIQISTLGMEKQKGFLLDGLHALLSPRGIYERSDVVSRKVEGLKLSTGLIYGEVPNVVEVMENGLRFLVDIKHGQKTGFFLDQRDNRAFTGKLAYRLNRNSKILNCFCYTGGFSIYAASYSAVETVNVDISGEALSLAEKNFELNALNTSRHKLVEDDVFEYLKGAEKAGKVFDMVILDPPAFTKNAATVPKAARGYKEINMKAMMLLSPGGFLITCSCSHHIDRMLFQKIIHDAALDAGRELQIIDIRGPALDHPLNAAHPEGEYLKVFVCRVV